MIDIENSEEWREFLFSTIQDFDAVKDGLVLTCPKNATPNRVKPRQTTTGNRRLPKEAVAYMVKWIYDNKSQHPSRHHKEKIAEATGLQLFQVNNWYHNHRKRAGKQSLVYNITL